MCLYPKKLHNRKYIPNQKNGGIVPELPITGNIKDYDQIIPIYDTRVLEIEVPCGNCEECRKGKARQWQVRLTEEIKQWKYKYFVTLTFAPKELQDICNKTRLNECNAVAGYAVRHMLERWRKDHKKSLKHWFVTELGHEGTERIHLHGIIFNNEALEFSNTKEEKIYKWKYWKYGHIYVGDYVTNRTINYIVKYINKIDTDHKGYIGQVLCSPGIGKSYIEKLQNHEYKYRPHNSIDYYILPNGSRIKLPKYYKNKLYNEDERELIWRDFMDGEKITIGGQTYSKQTTSEQSLNNIAQNAKKVNKLLGYGNDSKEWKKIDYNITRRMLQQVEREKRKQEMQEAINKIIHKIK